MNKKQNMEVILIADVDNLGAAHEKVSVKNGYARNYLIPRKLAVEANPSNLKQLEERMKQIAKKEAKMMAEINPLIEVLKASPLKIGAKTGTSGKIFGSVTSVQLARAVTDPDLSDAILAAAYSNAMTLIGATEGAGSPHSQEQQ